jgi:hypothetical protein
MNKIILLQFFYKNGYYMVINYSNVNFDESFQFFYKTDIKKNNNK